MSTPYAGAETYHATIDVLEGTDPRNAESVAVALRQLADRAAWLAANIGGGGAPAPYEGSGQTTDATPLTLITIAAADLPDDSAFAIRGVGVSRSSTGDALIHEFRFLFKKVAGVLSGAHSSDSTFGDSSLSGATVDALASSGDLLIQVTGLGGVTIDWAINFPSVVRAP